MSNLEPLIRAYVPLLYGARQYDYVAVRYWRNGRVVHVEYNWSGWPVTIKFIDNKPHSVYTDKWRPYLTGSHTFVQNRLALYDAGRIVAARGVYPFGRTSEVALSDSQPVLWWANDMTIVAPDGHRGVYFNDKSICGVRPQFVEVTFSDPKIDWHFEDYEYIFVIMLLIIIAAFTTVFLHKGLRAAQMADLDKKIATLGV